MRFRSGRPARWVHSASGLQGVVEHFYGSSVGDQPICAVDYRDTVPVEPDRTPEEGYHFTEDMTDRAIEWIRQQRHDADKPFFVYFAPAPRRAPSRPKSGRTSTKVNSTMVGTTPRGNF